MFLSPLSLGLFACEDFGSGITEPDTSADAVMNKLWTLYAFQFDGTPMAIPHGQTYRYWVLFDSNTTLRAQSDCNSCEGTYRIEPRQVLRIQATYCTEVACRPPTLDGTLQLALQRVSSYRHDDPCTLILIGDNGRTVLSFYHNIR